MKKLAYLFLIVLMFVGCTNNKEIRKIYTVKCKECGDIIYVDTTMVRGRYDKINKVFVTENGLYYIGFSYDGKEIKKVNDKFKICKKCRNDRIKNFKIIKIERRNNARG